MSSITKSRLIWALQILVAVAFLGAGGSKLAGTEAMVGMFEAIGFGQWLRYVTGIVEVVAAMLLLIPGSAALGGLLIVCTMTGAVVTHLFLIGGSAVPAIVLGLLGCAVLVLRPGQLGPLTGILFKANRV
jgi:putative oxidoreductase